MHAAQIVDKPDEKSLSAYLCCDNNSIIIMSTTVLHGM